MYNVYIGLMGPNEKCMLSSESKHGFGTPTEINIGLQLTRSHQHRFALSTYEGEKMKRQRRTSTLCIVLHYISNGLFSTCNNHIYAVEA